MAKARDLAASTFTDAITANGGIYLGGTGSSNLQDDYEFGSWSPFWSNNTGSAIFDTSPTVNMARYEKVGNMVTVWTYFNMGSGFGTTGAYSAGGNLCVGGLPFTANGDGSGGTYNYYAGTVGWYASWNNFDSSSNGYGPMVYTRTGTTTLQLVYPTFNAIADITQNFVNSNNSGIILSVAYQTAS